MTAPLLEPVGELAQSLTELTFQRIREAIVSQALAPGTRVSESSLANMLHVSKTPVREALLRLCHIGLVEPTPRGLQVVMPNAQIIRDVYEIRQYLESNAAEAAASRATEAQCSRIVAAAAMSHDRALAKDVDGFAEWDHKFHTGIADATGNSLVAKTVGDFVTLAFALRSRDTPSIDDKVDCGKQHIEIAEAISARDGRRASSLMAEHIADNVRKLGLTSEQRPGVQAHGLPVYSAAHSDA